MTHPTMALGKRNPSSFPTGMPPLTHEVGKAKGNVIFFYQEALLNWVRVNERLAPVESFTKTGTLAAWDSENYLL